VFQHHRERFYFVGICRFERQPECDFNFHSAFGGNSEEA
jgi:hypothetical protein